ncbi:MAG TPA: metallophosphoesterase family protein [Thermoleophilaceae bacterium]|jgi:predicted phosphodiesterase
MRIAVLADIHGNLPALRAVLAEVDAEPVDALVVPGDVVGGPLVREVLELLRERPEPVHWVSGNSEREALAVYDGEPPSDDPAGQAAAWSARALDDGWRDELASWPIALALDGVLFCHGSPRRDNELITRATPDDVLAQALAAVGEPLVVGGHTHQQMVRPVRDGLTYANAGSVGLPYEGEAGAFWMLVADGVPAPRKTAYDVRAAAGEMVASGYTDFEAQLESTILNPADPEYVTALFEHMAGRGPHPG